MSNIQKLLEIPIALFKNGQYQIIIQCGNVFWFTKRVLEHWSSQIIRWLWPTTTTRITFSEIKPFSFITSNVTSSHALLFHCCCERAGFLHGDQRKLVFLYGNLSLSVQVSKLPVSLPLPVITLHLFKGHSKISATFQVSWISISTPSSPPFPLS